MAGVPQGPIASVDRGTGEQSIEPRNTAIGNSGPQTWYVGTNKRFDVAGALFTRIFCDRIELASQDRSRGELGPAINANSLH